MYQSHVSNCSITAEQAPYSDYFSGFICVDLSESHTELEQIPGKISGKKSVWVFKSRRAFIVSIFANRGLQRGLNTYQKFSPPAYQHALEPQHLPSNGAPRDAVATPVVIPSIRCENTGVVANRTHSCRTRRGFVVVWGHLSS